MTRVFDIAFRRLYGLPCWGVQPGYGTFITLEFGQPHLAIREPQEVSPGTSPRVRQLLQSRIVTIRGDWHLWIYCCNWSVHQNGKLIGDNTSTRRIKRATETLNGQILESFKYVWRGCRSIFTFDLGATLETTPMDRKSEQWMLYQPSGKVLTLRADKKYSHNKQDTTPGDIHWDAISELA